MKNAKNAVMARQSGYEICVRKEELSTDLYRSFYGEVEAEAFDEAHELTGTEHYAFLKCACLLFVGAVGTVLTLLLF